MLSNEVYVEALELITDFLDNLGELEPSVEGYIDLLEYTIEEVNLALENAKADV